jgi:hypothetical protein
MDKSFALGLDDLGKSFQVLDTMCHVFKYSGAQEWCVRESERLQGYVSKCTSFRDTFTRQLQLPPGAEPLPEKKRGSFGTLLRTVVNILSDFEKEPQVGLLEQVNAGKEVVGILLRQIQVIFEGEDQASVSLATIASLGALTRLLTIPNLGRGEDQELATDRAPCSG